MKKPIKKKITAKPGKAFKTIAARKTPLPKPAVRKEITHEMIAKRAYEIFLSGRGGDQMHNWLAAERDLKAI